MLFTPVQVGHLTLKNRIVMPAIDLGFCPDGRVNQRLIRFYQERAAGGAGLIIIGGAAIESSEIYGGFLAICDDQMIPGHRQLTETVRAAGAVPGIQLFHAGRYSFAHLLGHRVVAPSAVPSRLTGHTPHPLTSEDIRNLLAVYRQAASRAQAAGYQVIEVISSAGYLINQFLSPLTNQRKDEYGGSFENRMRFGLELIHALRSAVGPEMVLSARLGGSDFMPGGNTWREMSTFAAELEKAGVDLLNVTGGWHESNIPLIQAEVPRGGYAYLARKVKEKVSIPVVASNRINDPVIAEKVLISGQADLVSVARGFLADERWAVKAMKKSETIRRCIGCMTCMEPILNHEMASSSGVLCAINARCGFEAERKIKTAQELKEFLIIGAGPAGLEAARVAALQGHRVTVWEKESSPGGQWNIASVPPGKGEFASLLDYYENVLRLLGVEIMYNKTADVEAVKKEAPDYIIVASGAVPAALNIPISPEANVLNAWEVLKGVPLKGPEVVVIGGGSVGCETAGYISELGTISGETARFMLLHQSETPDTIRHLITHGTYRVTLVEAASRLAPDIVSAMRWTVIKHLRLMGVDVHLGSLVKSIEAQGVVVEKDDSDLILPADTVVIAAGSQPEQTFYQELQSRFDHVYLVGDAVRPGKVMDAIHSAFDLITNL